MSLRLYNFPFEARVGRRTYFPTVARLPGWMAEPRYRAAVALPGRPSVRVVGPYSEEGLEQPMEGPAPSTMDWDRIVAWSREIAPVEDPSIVSWMHTCVPKGHLVITTSGPKDVSEVSVGDRVLTHTGRFARVTKTFKRPYRGKLIGIKLVGFPDTIWFTPEHPILVGIRELKGAGYRRREYKILWIRAGDLQVPREKVMGGAYKRRLYCLLPIPRADGDGFARPSAPLARFIGYFLAEGSTHVSSGGCRIELTNSDSKIIDDMVKSVREAFGKEPYVWEDKDGVAKVRIISKELYTWLRANFGTNAHNKRIPGWLLAWPAEYIQELLIAYWYGDGSYQPRNGYHRIAYHTSSKMLAIGLRLLELKLDRETTIFKRKDKEHYVVYVNNPEGRKGCPEVRIVDNYLWMPIKEIVAEDFDGYVYNMEVEGDNSYVVDTIATHNCHAANVVISARMEEYKRLGSSLVGASDDPFIPGLKVEDIRFRSERGRDVAARGYAVLETPRGSVNVPVPGKATAVFRDLLAWGAVLEAFLVQWTGVLLKWRELATNPGDRVAFPSFRGLAAPQFFVHSSSVPAPVNIARFSITTDRPQTITIRARNVNDYTDVMFEDRIQLGEGRNEVELPIFGFPVVPAMVIEIQPEDGAKTILDWYEVIP
ncbi:MAG: hypothetical protein DRO39_03500 [Thermoprotei archaeon]|nr:MAG: hypothetical protein DRO39_03500 [Thermoprotei archaeon]